jgi:hypothetical protein
MGTPRTIPPPDRERRHPSRDLCRRGRPVFAEVYHVLHKPIHPLDARLITRYLIGLFMPVFTKSAKPRLAAPRAGWRSAFSLAEVMVASCVLMLGISGALVTLRRSLDTIAQARQLDAASQLMQTELERLRLLNWSQLQTLQTSGQTAVDAPTGGDFARYTCERHIRDLRDGMKEITFGRLLGRTGWPRPLRAPDHPLQPKRSQ